MRTYFVAILVVLLVHVGFIEAKPNNNGLYDLNCPVDDDPNNPTHLTLQGDCTKFRKCSYGKAYVISCPRNLHWSEQLDRCESPEVANCDPKLTTPKPEIGGGGCSFDFKPDPSDCSKFIMCASGREVNVSCLAGMHYDASAKKCVEGEC